MLASLKSINTIHNAVYIILKRQKRERERKREIRLNSENSIEEKKETRKIKMDGQPFDRFSTGLWHN